MRVCYNKTMKIHIGADHAGFHLKESLKKWLLEEGHEVVDHGANTENQEDDYPDFIAPVARAIAGDPERSRGVILGGSDRERRLSQSLPKVRAAVTMADRNKSSHLHANITTQIFYRSEPDFCHFPTQSAPSHFFL